MSTVLVSVVIGIALLLFLILVLKLHAFIALLISSIIVGLMSGLSPDAVMDAVKTGMGGTLGFVATVVGLGAILGGILESAGGVKVISQKLLSKFGKEKAPTAMMISGFLISIPVFFDVAFIILVPVIYALQRETKKSLLLYAIPLLAGLAVTHAFIPPTPGPVAVADILNARLGYVIIIGFCVGLPTVLISGLIFGRYISNKIHIAAPIELKSKNEDKLLPSFGIVLSIIALPILLILLSTFSESGILSITEGSTASNLISLFGHPFTALIIANIMAWYFLGIRQGFSLQQLSKISQDSLKPAGTIILLTGAGGVFKQILVDTKAGEQLANLFLEIGLPILFFAFITAVIIRLVQGSATVAMITAAGLVSPLLANANFSAAQLACLVIAIASGASIFSHVNDSGFWLVSQYLKMDEKQTLQSWSVMTLILALSGFFFVSLIFLFL